VEVKQAMSLNFKGRKIVKGQSSGEALVSREPISFLGGVDTATGNVTEKGHDLEGFNITGKVLIYPTGKGSTGGSYKIYDMAYRKTAPAALINLEAEPITAIGAVIGNIPMVDGIPEDILDLVESGDWVDVDANAETVRVTKKSKP